MGKPSVTQKFGVAFPSHNSATTPGKIQQLKLNIIQRNLWRNFDYCDELFASSFHRATISVHGDIVDSYESRWWLDWALWFIWRRWREILLPLLLIYAIGNSQEGVLVTQDPQVVDGEHVVVLVTHTNGSTTSLAVTEHQLNNFGPKDHVYPKCYRLRKSRNCNVFQFDWQFQCGDY